MKQLIISSIFLSFSVMAAGPEIVSKEDSNQIVSTIKDIEIKNMLESSQEFDSCKKLNEFKKEDVNNPTAQNKKIKDAQACIKNKIGNKDAEALKKLSESLNLQQYGLIKSNTTKEIQEYLNNKMYESLTGVKPDEKDKQKLVESLKFKNKKHIDQGLFIRLYKTQLSKNALFEISRYCLHDFRNNAKTTGNNFAEYWGDFETVATIGMDPKTNDKSASFTIANVNDFGTPAFNVSVVDPDKKDDIYKDIVQNMTGTGSNAAISTDNLKLFFTACSQAMVKMCDDYKSSLSPGTIKSDVDTGLAAGSTPPANPAKPGAVSCLTKSRIQEIKKALADVEKVESVFAEMQENDKTLLIKALTKGEPVKIFKPGEEGSESLDNLTNYTSYDMLNGGDGPTSANDKYKDCDTQPGNSACADLIGDKEKFDKVKNAVETDMLIKRELEIKRVLALKKEGEQKLEDYLKENGYFGLVEKLQNGGLNDTQLEEAIANEFDARKVATLQQMNKKMGSRQAKENATDQEKAQIATDVLKESKEERARLAQVVMFNNVVTSHLELTRKKSDGTYEKAGRNVNAWSKEEKALTEKAKVDPTLFKNLKATDTGQGGSGSGGGKGIGNDDTLGGIEFIDNLLGKTDKIK